MDTEELLKAIKQDNEQTRLHFDVVAESLKSDIRLLAEGHGVLVEKVDGLGTRMDRLETKVDQLETKVDHLETKLDGFIVETRANFEEVRASIKFSYAELDRRLTFLESGFKDLSARMASLEGRQTH